MRRLFLAPLTLLLALAACAPATAGAVTYKGKLQILHSDDFRHGRGQTTWTVRTLKGKRIKIVPTAPTGLPSGSKVTVRGRRSGKFVAGRITRRGPAPLHAASALGDHKVAVILIKFPGTTAPWTRDYVKGRILTDPDSTATFYDEESGGAVTLSGDVFGWYDVAGTPGSCNVSTWSAQAQQAASNAGVDLSGYDHLQYVFPYQSSCGGWAGLGELGGSQTWLNGYIEPWVAAHELGHNMGLHHASSYTCTSDGVQVTLSSTCTADEYGDPFDVMGDDTRHNNAWHLSKLGIVRPSEVQTVSTGGDYTVRSFQSGASGPVLLRVPAGNGSGRYYDLSILQAGGIFDDYLSSDPVVNGVSMHYDPAGGMTQSLLLDAKPGVGAFLNSSLAQGGTFANGDVSITATNVSPGVAQVSVVMGTPVDSTPPSPPALAAQTTRPGGVDLTWSAASDDTAVAGYRVYRDDLLVANTSNLTWADSGLVYGSVHKYRLTAFDAAGNSTPSNAVYATVASPPPGDDGQDPPNPDGGGNPQPPGDSTGPTVRITSPGKGARIRSRATITANARDNVKVVRLTLTIDAVQVASVKTSRLKRTWSVRGVRPGIHAITVTAYDAQGNAGTRTLRVRVLRPRG